jgi:membrane associated rhomboid family serine protease
VWEWKVHWNNSKHNNSIVWIWLFGFFFSFCGERNLILFYLYCGLGSGKSGPLLTKKSQLLVIGAIGCIYHVPPPKNGQNYFLTIML